MNIAVGREVSNTPDGLRFILAPGLDSSRTHAATEGEKLG